ncbi:MAG: glycosyltransferase [Acidimicrobiales bacterium]
MILTSSGDQSLAGPGVSRPAAPVPGASFDHVFRLSDDTGLLEHARGALPRRERGYCLDDVARGLLALSREPEPSAEQVNLAGRYLTFVSHAQGPSGACHNRLGYDRRWEDEAGTGDWWGRALWALGSVVSGSGPQWQRREALDRFCSSSRCRPASPRALAFATLGAAEVITAVPDHREARSLLTHSVTALGRPRAGEAWPWPEERLSYANAAIAEAWIAAGRALGDDRAVDDGLFLLAWLVELQTVDRHLSLVPAAGFGPGDERPGFDQQPIEVAALADACARAFAVTGEPQWQIVVSQCVGWFLGRNDSGSPMYDPETGGGYDGLEVGGANTNQGAESTLALLLTLQHGQKTALDPC